MAERRTVPGKCCSYMRQRTRVYTDCSQEYHQCAAMGLGTVYWFGVHKRMTLISSRNVSNPVKQRFAVSSGPGKGYGECMHFLITTITVVVYRREEPHTTMNSATVLMNWKCIRIFPQRRAWRSLPPPTIPSTCTVAGEIIAQIFPQQPK